MTNTDDISKGDDTPLTVKHLRCDDKQTKHEPAERIYCRRNHTHVETKATYVINFVETRRRPPLPTPDRKKKRKNSDAWNAERIRIHGFPDTFTGR